MALAHRKMFINYSPKCDFSSVLLNRNLFSVGTHLWNFNVHQMGIYDSTYKNSIYNSFFFFFRTTLSEIRLCTGKILWVGPMCVCVCVFVKIFLNLLLTYKIQGIVRKKWDWWVLLKKLSILNPGQALEWSYVEAASFRWSVYTAGRHRPHLLTPDRQQTFPPPARRPGL